VQLEYLGAPAPVCELSRIKHLHDLQVLYTPPEQRFDDITRLCTLVFKVSAHACDHPGGGVPHSGRCVPCVTVQRQYRGQGHTA
jgi:hypothetical protein